MSKWCYSTFAAALWILCCKECSGTLRDRFFNGPCSVSDFWCENDNCVSKQQFCNGINDCGDSSDENYCSGWGSCPQFFPFFKCYNLNRCIPEAWHCDGVHDCGGGYGEDEQDCGDFWKDENKVTVRLVHQARRKAVDWIYNQARNNSSTDRWGSQVQRIVLALYLSSGRFDYLNGSEREMAYELNIKILSLLTLKRMDEVQTDRFAAYINALRVACLDPSKFHSLNLLKELRRRVNAQDFTNPYDLLTMCSAGERLTKKDVDKLIYAFRNPHHQVWTETQAIAVMGLVCAAHQTGLNFSMNSLKDFTYVLKQKQFRNGTVENVKTTALVLQALFASGPEDEDNFDEEKAMLQILRAQREDGSFGSLVDTYYVLPVLAIKSLVNVSADHCPKPSKDEESALDELINQPGPKIRVRYTLWIGNAKDVERSLKLRVPQSSSFFDVIEIARDIDHKFSFEYIMKDTKPYITAISGLADDPETGKFWFPYTFNGTEPSLWEKSPADLFLNENDHVALWYRSGEWIK